MHEGPEGSCRGSVLGKAMLACPQACPHVTAMAGDLGTSSHKDLVEYIQLGWDNLHQLPLSLPPTAAKKKPLQMLPNTSSFSRLCWRCLTSANMLPAPGPWEVSEHKPR